MTHYLSDIPKEEALERLEAALKEAGLWGVLGVEQINLGEQAVGRVTASPIWARISSPNYDAAAMDGFAVRSQDTAGALPSAPLELATSLDQDTGRTASSSTPGEPVAHYVDTGDALPRWADAVIPVEQIEALGITAGAPAAVRLSRRILVRAAVVPRANVRALGEDIVASQLVLPAGQVLRAVDLGAIAAAGHAEIRVARRPRVAVLPTGSELVPVGTTPAPGDIIEFNSIVVAAQVNEYGGLAERLEPARDDLDLICERLRRAGADHDLILLNAGSSAGTEDFSSRAIERLGQVLVHGVAVSPGHPVIIGMLDLPGPEAQLRRWVPVIGLPGYPVSSALTVEIFVEPLLARWLGRPPRSLDRVTAEVTRKLVSPAGDDDYVRVAVGRVGDRLLAAPLSRGAGVITSLVHADGIALLPRGVQGVGVGEPVSVSLYRFRPELEQTIFCTGSHDLTLDLLAQALSAYGRRLVVSNVGSQGGLLALARRQSHLAGSHLFDPETGSYNVPFLKEYLTDLPVRVIGLAWRQQGLFVRNGNPSQLVTLRDLTRQGIRFVNRQRGSGTRVLLDYHLAELGLAGELIDGYDHEEYTHLAVAAAVAAGRADAGLGIAAAADALGLDFVPLFRERYDLIVPLEHARGALLEPLFRLLGEEEYRTAVAGLRGYDTSVMGKVVFET